METVKKVQEVIEGLSEASVEVAKGAKEVNGKMEKVRGFSTGLQHQMSRSRGREVC
jgi:hypothetical protein